MRKFLLTTTVLSALLGAHAAHAVCQGAAGLPFNCTNATNAPGQNDIVFGGVTSGPQNGQSVRWSWGQIFTGTTLTSPVIINGTINSLNAPLAGLYGGTGVANSGDTITLGGNIITAGAFTISGAHALTFTITGDTNITLPTSGTILGTTLPSGDIYVGNVSNVATGVAMSGDVGITNAGATTVSEIGGTTISLGAATALGAASSTIGAGTYYAGHSLIGIQTFCASGCTATGGTYTPDTGTNRVIIEAQAAGGASGSCPATTAGQVCVSSAAAGGSYAKVLYTTSFSGITMTIGAAGVPGAAGANPGGTGSTTTAGALISCPGGTGGIAGTSVAASVMSFLGNPTAGPAVCTVAGGTVLLSVAGQGTGLGLVSSTTIGLQTSAQGGNAMLGLGGSAAYNSATLGGVSGTGYGSGPSGAIMDASQSARAGIAGQPAIIIVYEYN